MSFPIPDFRTAGSKLDAQDRAGLDAVGPKKLDVLLWLDVLRDTATRRFVSRHDWIDSALTEARPHSRERFR